MENNTLIRVTTEVSIKHKILPVETALGTYMHRHTHTHGHTHTLHTHTEAHYLRRPRDGEDSKVSHAIRVGLHGLGSRNDLHSTENQHHSHHSYRLSQSFHWIHATLVTHTASLPFHWIHATLVIHTASQSFHWVDATLIIHTASQSFHWVDATLVIHTFWQTLFTESMPLLSFTQLLTVFSLSRCHSCHSHILTTSLHWVHATLVISHSLTNYFHWVHATLVISHSLTNSFHGNATLNIHKAPQSFHRVEATHVFHTASHSLCTELMPLIIHNNITQSNKPFSPSWHH